MLAYFFISSLAIFAAGPLHNEGGAQAIEEKGTKAAIETAVAERQPLDYSKLND